ncbi:hypothetical protein SEA_ROSEPHARIE_86 [Streptomyces phage RosePharie]|nr:hypothetical protein SEA_ROSEPHARIE_86 [Streptomyces phage RosePharie]
MQYTIGYTIEERHFGVTAPGAAELWTLGELCDMGLSRLVECALDRLDGAPSTPLPIMDTGESEVRVMAHRSLPIVPKVNYCDYGHDYSERKAATMYYLSVGRGNQYLCADCVHDVEQGGGILFHFLEPVSK